MTVRPVAQSLFPDHVAEKAIGPLPLSVQTGTNADLMFAIRELYLTGSVLDVTYGNGPTAGGWWRRVTPDPFTFHDLAVDGVDFRHLPEPNRSIDTVCFDPPYVMSGGPATRPGANDLRDRFGIDGYRTEAEFRSLLSDGLSECARVARRFVLVKCMEFVGSARFTDMAQTMKTWAAALPIQLHDQIVHYSGVGPGGHNIFEPVRCRRAHSYLLVFAVPS